MSDSRSLTRLPVYDVSNGRVVGRVHRLIVDPDARKVAGLLLSTRLGRESRCLPFRNVHAVGEHAVTVRGTDAVVRLSDLPEMDELARSRRRLHHSPVLTEDGTFVGDVDEFTVNSQTGRIETLLMSGGMVKELFRGQVALPAHLVVTIGEDATIVRDQAVSLLKQRQAAPRPTRSRRRAEPLDLQELRTEEQNDGLADGGVQSHPRRFPAPRWWHRLFSRRTATSDADLPVLVVRAEGPDTKEEPVDPKVPTELDGSPPVAELPHQPRLQQHRAQDGHHIVPSVTADGGEGGDGKF